MESRQNCAAQNPSYQPSKSTAAKHVLIPKAEPREVLRFLMEQHGLKQEDLKHCAPQSRLSDILTGKRSISKELAKNFARRFHVAFRCTQRCFYSRQRRVTSASAVEEVCVCIEVANDPPSSGRNFPSPRGLRRQNLISRRASLITPPNTAGKFGSLNKELNLLDDPAIAVS
jgi:transcriptional regulator with XRE-family HTH domain